MAHLAALFQGFFGKLVPLVPFLLIELGSLSLFYNVAPWFVVGICSFGVMFMWATMTPTLRHVKSLTELLLLVYLEETSLEYHDI